MIRAGDLQGAAIRNEAGRMLGHVEEIHLKDGQVSTLIYGVGGLLQRFWPWRGGGRIDWKDVVKVEPGRLVVRAKDSARASDSSK